MTKKNFVLASAILATLAGGPMAARAEAVATAVKPPSVTVARAERGTIIETASVTGTLVAREEILVSPQVDQVAITAILAEEGDSVKTGQVLARLSRETFDAQMGQNTAQIARDQAAIAQAEATKIQADAAFARAHDLVRTATASRETYDTRQAASLTAAAQVASAKADLAYAQAQRQELAVKLVHTDITAPVGGIVSRRVARLGSVVSMGGDPLFRIISFGAIELEADVPESVLTKLRPGQRAELDMAGGANRSGNIRLVAPEMNRTSRLGRIRIAIDPDAQGKWTGLVIGGFARAVIGTAAHEGIKVPLSAVQFSADGPRVQVVRDGVVETRPVTLGLREEGSAEIAAGLLEGEQVVAISGTFVRNGDHVIAIDPGTQKPVLGKS
jgi:RND family efflux transporter MFP subunit